MGISKGTVLDEREDCSNSLESQPMGKREREFLTTRDLRTTMAPFFVCLFSVLASLSDFLHQSFGSITEGPISHIPFATLTSDQQDEGFRGLITASVLTSHYSSHRKHYPWGQFSC